MNGQNLNPRDALQIVSRACCLAPMTLNDHNATQQALIALQNYIIRTDKKIETIPGGKPKPEKPPETGQGSIQGENALDTSLNEPKQEP